MPIWKRKIENINTSIYEKNLRINSCDNNNDNNNNNNNNNNNKIKSLIICNFLKINNQKNKQKNKTNKYQMHIINNPNIKLKHNKFKN